MPIPRIYADFNGLVPGLVDPERLAVVMKCAGAIRPSHLHPGGSSAETRSRLPAEPQPDAPRAQEWLGPIEVDPPEIIDLRGAY